MLVFVYSTRWYGLPAMLKGRLTNIRKIAVISTCGAPWLWMKFVSDPGRRTLTRGARAICHPKCRAIWLAHYRIDSLSVESWRDFLMQVEKQLGRFCAR